MTSTGSCGFKDDFWRLVTESVPERGLREQSGYAVSVFDRATGNSLCSVAINFEQTVYPASTIKILVAMAVFKKIDEGQISPAKRVAIHQKNAERECEDWDCNRYGPGKLVAVQDLLFDMLTVSNNLATNQLIDLVGKPFINESADALGAPGLRVYRKVYNHVDPEPEIKTRNTANVAGLTELYRELATGRLQTLKPKSRAAIIDILAHQQHNDRLNGDFPPDVTFFHKPGNTSQVTGDAGFYYLDGERAVVIAGLQNFAYFKQDGHDVSGYDTLRRLGRGVLDLTRETFKR